MRAIGGTAHPALENARRRLRANPAGPLLALLFAVPLSGPVRVLSGFAPDKCLWLAALLSGLLGLAWCAVVPPGPRDERPWLPRATLFAALFGYTLLRLYNPYFSGMPAQAGGDLGQHVTYFEEIMTVDPKLYFGMSTLPATDHWLRAAFRWVPLQSMRFEFYGTVALFLAILAADGAAPRASKESSRAGWLRAALIAALALPVLELLCLPLFHYLEGAGYLPQLGALIPILLCIHLQGRLENPWRLLMLGAAILCLRYTYVLNLSDFILACGVAALFESRAEPSARLRFALRIAGGLLFAAAVYSYAQIYQAAIHIGGDMLLGRAPWVATGLFLSAAALVVFAVTSDDAAAARRPMFVGALAMGAALAIFAWLGLRIDRPYYVHKYGFIPALLVALECVLTLAALLRQPRSRIQLGAIACAAAGLVVLGLGYSAYRPGYLERASYPGRLFAGRGSRGAPPWRALTPLLEPKVDESIRAALNKAGGLFGGFATTRWPESCFTNASFGISYFDYPMDGNYHLEEDRCVFWYAPVSLLPKQARAIISNLKQMFPSRCDSFHPLDAPAQKTQLCHLCLGPNAKSLGPEAPDVVSSGLLPRERGGFWTDGHASIRFQFPPRAADCALYFNAADSAFSATLDGAPLPPHFLGLYRIPRPLVASPAGAGMHELKLDSDSLQPGPRGTLFRSLSLLCSDRIPFAEP